MKRLQCREKCGTGGPDGDGFFATKQGESVHYIRTHSGRTWNSKNKSSKRAKRGKKVADQEVQTTSLAVTARPVKLVDRVEAILRQNKGSMQIADIIAKLGEQGLSITNFTGTRNQISLAARQNPNILRKVSRGVYGLAEEGPTPHGIELSKDALVAILQHESRRNRDLVLRTVHAFGEIVMLATEPMQLPT